MKKKTYKKNLALVLALVMVFTAFGGSFAFAGEGAIQENGTKSNVVTVTDGSQLPTDGIPAGTIYELENDVTLDKQISDIAGTLDGKGHTITLTGKALANEVTGTIRNLGVTGEVYAELFKSGGVIANNLNGGRILNCYSTASIEGFMADIGGFVADFKNGAMIKNSFFAGDMPGADETTKGGLVSAGYDPTTSITDSYYVGIGNAAGFGNQCTLENCEEKTLEEIKSYEMVELLNNKIRSTGFIWENDETGDKLPHLVPGVIPADKTALQQILAEADNITDETAYMEQGWKAFAEAKTIAKTVFENNDAGQDDVDEAEKALKSAMNNLEPYRPTEPVSVASDAVAITSQQDLQEISDAEGKCYVLKNDIVLDDTYQSALEFNGVFDGNGHSVKFENAQNALFDSIGENGVIQNTHFTGTLDGTIGAVANGTIKGAIVNCFTDVSGASAFGFARNISDWGIIANCYSISEAGNGCFVNSCIEDKGAVYNSYWAKDLSMNLEGKVLRNGSKEKFLDDMRTRTFLALMNRNKGTYGTVWGQNGETGYPYFGEDKEYIEPEETFEPDKYPVVFKPANGKTPFEVQGQRLDVSPNETNALGFAGDLNLKNVPEDVTVTWDKEIRKTFTGDASWLLGTIGGPLRVDDWTGEAVVTARNEETHELLATVKIVSSINEIEAIKLFIDDTEATNSKFSLKGSEEKRIIVKGKYADSEDYVTIASNRFTYIADDQDMVYNEAAYSSFYFKKPGTSKITVRAKADSSVSATVTVTSEYVPVESVSLGLENQYVLHQLNANGWDRKQFNPELAGIDVKPANASNRSDYTITSSNQEVGDFNINGYIPLRWGETTLTLKLNDKDPATGKTTVFEDSKTVKNTYLNPLKAISLDAEEITVESGKKVDLGIHFTGARDAEGYSVSDAEMVWTYDTEGVAAVGTPEFGYWKKDSEGTEGAPDYADFLTATNYQVEGLSEGTVIAIGTPVDKTNGLKPVTVKITVTPSTEAERPLDELIAEGIASAVEYIKEKTASYEYGKEWQVMGLMRGLEEREFSVEAKDSYYNNAVGEIKGWSETQKPTDLARTALALASIGKDITDLEGINLAEKMYNHPNLDTGSNDLCWSLMALDAKKTDIPADAKWTRNKIIDTMLEYQNNDGGFGLNKGEGGSIDMTAMCIQSLAPYKDQAKVKTAIDKGLAFLQKKQDNQGGFGTSEGTAQVILALTVLDKDPTDEAEGFVKVAGNPIRNLMKYYTDKGFTHTMASYVTEMSTVQALQALDSYQRMKADKNSYWDLSDVETVIKQVSQDVEAEKIGNEATAELGEDAAKDLVNDALNDNAKEIIVSVTGTEKADKVNVDIPLSMAESIAENSKASLIVSDESSGAALKLDKETLKTAVEKITDNQVRLVIQKNTLTEEQTKLLGDDAAGFDFKLMSADGETVVTDFGKGKVVVTVPCPELDKPTAVHIDAENKLTKLGGFTFDRDGQPFFQFETKHFSAFAVMDSKTADKIIREQAGIPEPEDITVTFTLLGDKIHDSDKDGNKHTLSGGGLETWISKKTVTVPEGSTMKDVLETALAGTSHKITYRFGGDYVSAITTPGGQTLAEFTNGINSGWMYTVNGSHPDIGLSVYKVKNGDDVIWHYTDDHKKEGAALDEEAAVSKDINAAVKDGEALATIGKSDIDKLISDAVKNEASVIDLNIKASGAPDKFIIELPKQSVADVADKTDAALKINTESGKAVLDRKTMTEIVKAAEGEKVQIVIEKKAPTPELQDALGKEMTLTEVTILSNDKEISTFGTAKLKLQLTVPAALKDKTLAAAYVDENGKLEKIEGKKVTVDGKTFFQIETPHLSQFVVAEESVIDAAIAAQGGETDAEKADRIKAGVKNTTIKVKSIAGKTKGKHYIKLTWKKSKGYKVDYFEVYKSTKKGTYSKTPYFKTKNGTWKSYKNSKGLKKGIRYYYKVRGVRKIDGKKVYTKWSNQAIRTSK